MKTLFYAFVILGWLGGACRKSAPAKSSWTAGSDIYIVGSDNDGHAVYWKNGQKKVLASKGVGYGITVVGSDVYVGGVVYTAVGNNTVAAYWKNGTETDLGPATGASWSFQPVVQGPDVYVPGYVLEAGAGEIHPVYWKNSQQVLVESVPRGEVTGMAVSDTDIYVIGTTFDYRTDTAHLWKNGVRVLDISASNGSGFGQVLVAGSEVYVAGFQGYYVYGKQSVVLPSAGGVRGMFVASPDIYATGWWLDSVNHPHPGYWKNGVLTVLPGYPSGGYTQSFGIAVAGSDLYVVGMADVGTASAGIYWKNGVEDSLCGNCRISGIAVGN